MKEQFDVVVIGSGVSGIQVAFSLSKKMRCAIVEKRDFGGTCVLRGCDPKKVLVGGMEAVHLSKRLRGHGIKQKASISWPDLMAFKKSFVEDVPASLEKSFIEAGIETFKGEAKFIDEHTIEVDGQRLTANYFVIATGASPVILDIKGKEHLKTSDDFLSLESLPQNITFIGGGYIAFELAAIASAAGSEVHVILHNSKPLKAFDPDHVALLVSELQEMGVIFHFDTDVQEVLKQETHYLLTGNDFNLKTELVFSAIGRHPNTKALQLEKAKVDYDNHGINVNQYLEATKNIYACGDVANTKGLPLTPVDSFEANAVVEQILSGRKEVRYPVIPSVVFSSPKLAQIGISAEEAMKDLEKYHVNEIDMTNWYTYRRTNEALSAAKIITEKTTGKVCGVSLISEEAEEMINYFVLIINAHLTLDELKQYIFAYPGAANDLTSLL
ncbi:NAD(P)/FAD-dependent oxidoreductase [Listeria sp. PSOL-1]|uniref:dihydrolipoyl dehydrogenase family protein n=1 Tax=Listeria sp. PSOL-1 TaxID=1844999 RepID=UPI0013D8968F|nr:NAD(P)/FAD-dependent oxidoreductase [Listeria sp. PSOL-1]